MEPLTQAQERQLRENHQLYKTNPEMRPQFLPVAYVWFGANTLILTELDENGTLFGIIDYGSPCFGSVLVSELRDSAKRLGIRRVKSFPKNRTIAELLLIAERDGFAWIP